MPGGPGARRRADWQMAQQRNVMSWIEKQMMINVIVSKGEYMGESPKVVYSQTLETLFKEISYLHKH